MRPVQITSTTPHYAVYAYFELGTIGGYRKLGFHDWQMVVLYSRRGGGRSVRCDWRLLQKDEVFAPYYRYTKSLVIGSYAGGGRRGRGGHSGVFATPSFERSPLPPATRPWVRLGCGPSAAPPRSLCDSRYVSRFARESSSDRGERGEMDKSVS